MGSAKKISTKIWRPVLEKLDEKLEAACLRRDAYLSKLLHLEVGILDREVSIPNSSDSTTFISARLDSLDRKLVTLTLDFDVVERLNEVCAKKRIVRDAFFNRIFLLLAASPKLIDRLFFGIGVDWQNEVWAEYRNSGPYVKDGFYPLDQDIDPFWAIRAGIENLHQDDELSDFIEPESGETIRVRKDFEGNAIPPESLYTSIFRNKELKDTDLYGMNTFLPDWEIAGHPTALARDRRLDDLLEAL